MLSNMIQAAEQGDAEAQFALGMCYVMGDGVIIDEAEAVVWWRKAAEQDLALARYHLGMCYLMGAGVLASVVEAYKWLRLAGVAGYADAGAECAELAAQMTAAQLAEAEARAQQWARPASEISQVP